MKKEKIFDYAVAFVLAGCVALISTIREDRCMKEEIKEEVERQLAESKEGDK